MGLPECLKCGLEMSPDEPLAHGVNPDTTHVDFMIGADPDLNIWEFLLMERNTTFVNGHGHGSKLPHYPSCGKIATPADIGRWPAGRVWT